jgi:hypothetical protein
MLYGIILKMSHYFDFERYKYLKHSQFALFKDKLSASPGSEPLNSYTDQGIEYIHNKTGQRCDDFSKNEASQNFLFAGCSYTYGLGIPYQFSWGYKLNKDLGSKKFYSLASPGRDFQVIINDIYQYIRMFGKPKGIFAMFPNLDRDHRVNFKIDNNKQPHYEIQNISLLGMGSGNTRKSFNTPEEFQTVHDYIRIETLSYNFYNALYQLEDYLEAIGVPFLWTTWYPQLAESISGETKMFKNYFLLDFSIWEKYKKDNFYPPESLGENRKYWLEAVDKPNPHPGIMEHEFYASQFLSKFDGI